MSKTFQTLTVNAMTGNTYWQKAQDSVEDAQAHAHRYTRNTADFFIYEISDKINQTGNMETIRLIKTITHRGI